MKVGCIVLNWNNYEDTKECLLSIKESKTEIEKIVVLVDNNSTDGSYEKLKEELKSHDIYFLRNNENRGYAGGINSGIRYIMQKFDCNYVIALNNDVLVPDYFFDNMYQVALKNDIDILSPVFLDYSTLKVKYEGVRKFFKPLLQPIQIRGNYGKLECWKAKVVMGGAMMFSKKFLQKEHWLYEPFFLYCEEDEVCIRATIKGYNIGVCGRTVIYDKGKMSIKKGKFRRSNALYFTVRNRFILAKLFRKYGYFSDIDSLLFNMFFPLACLFLASYFIVIGSWETAQQIIKGVKHGIEANVKPHYIYL